MTTPFVQCFNSVPTSFKKNKATAKDTLPGAYKRRKEKKGKRKCPKLLRMYARL